MRRVLRVLNGARRLCVLAWLIAVAAVSGSLYADVQVVPLSAVWSYQQGTNLDGVGWQATAFNDTDWPAGSALLYVENNTSVSPRNTPLTIGSSTYYFRTHFNLAYSPTNVLLIFSARIDDGAVFYLNGTEVRRVRMMAAPTPLYYTNLATATPTTGDAVLSDTFTLVGAALTNLVLGDNVLAAEVHQNVTNSDDIVFGSSLTVRFTNSPPILLQQPTNLAVLDGRAAALTAVVDGQPTPLLQWFKDGDALPAATNVTLSLPAAYPTNAGTYWLTASNLNGVAVTTNSTLTVLPDTNAPVILTAIAQKTLTNISITFSEPVVAALATNLANYEIHQTIAPSSRLNLLRASLGNSSNVVLITNPRIAGAHYTLGVTGICDIASVSNYISPGTTQPLNYQVDLLAVDAQTQWRFFQSGSQPATNWGAADYDDSGWPAGAAIFHAGSPLPGAADPVRTTLSLTAGTNAVTAYYFRTVFNLPGVVDTNTLRLHDIADDGAVFYLNGSEAFSIGMPAARPVAYATNASRSVGIANYEPAITSSGFAFSGAALLGSSNVLAAEVHQFASGYSDVAFAANVDAVISNYYPLLRWTLPAQVQEGAGTLTNQAQLSIVEPLAVDLPVQLASSRPAELSAPPSVTIPAGATNVVFDLMVADDGLYNASRPVTLTAQAAEGVPALATMQLLDDETNILSIVAPAIVNETSTVFQAEVRVANPVSGNITVALSSSDLTELAVSASVNLPNGATSAVFQVTVLDDLLLDGAQSVNLTAAVAGWTSGQSAVVVDDNEPAIFTMKIPPSAYEGAGVLSNALQLTTGGLAVSNLPVTFATSLPEIVALPTNAVILAGQSNAQFDLQIRDNFIPEADRVVTITAAIGGLPTATNSMTIVDNDPHRIRFGPAPRIVTTNEGVSLMMYAETASGAIQTLFNGNVTVVAEGIDGPLPVLPTNLVSFYSGQRYASFQVPVPASAVRLRALEYPGQSDPYNVVIPPFLSVTQKVADIAWHLPSQTIYASVPASAPSYSNCLVAINPQTRQVINAYPIGYDPSQIELSPSGNFLYVALSNRTSLRRFDLNTLQAGLQYPLATNVMPFRFAYDFCVPPGMADSVVVEARDQNELGSQSRAGIYRYDSGAPVALPNLFATGGWLMESLTNGTEMLLSSPLLRANAASGSVLTTATNFLGTAAYYRDGRIYDDRGNAYAEASLGNLGSYPDVTPDGRYKALVQVNSDQRRVFTLSGYANFGTTFFKLRTFDRDLFQPLSTFDVPATPGGPTRFIRCGTNGLAYATGDGQLWFIVSEGVESTAPAADLALSLSAVPPLAVVGSNFTFSLVLSNGGPGMASLVRITNTLPANVTLVQTTSSQGSVSATNSTFTWNVAPLPAASNATLEVTVRFNTAGSQTINSTALGFESDPMYANNTLSLPVYVQLAPTAFGAFAINVTSEDLLYDPARDRLLLSVADGGGSQTNGILVLNPHTGLTDSFLPLGKKPGKLARSDDGQFLYVSLPAEATVRQLDLPTFATIREFGLGSEDIYGLSYPFFAADIAAVPGAPDSIAVWRVRRAGPMASEFGRGVAIVDSGVVRSNAAGAGGSWKIEYDTNSGALFAFNSGDLQLCAVDASGVSFAETYPHFYSSGDDAEYAAGRLFTTTGRILETQPLRLGWVLAGAETASLVEPDAASGRVFYLITSTGQIRAYDISSRRFLGTLPFQYLSGTPSSLVRWGTNGLAFRTSGAQVYVVRSPLLQPEASADVGLQISAPSTPVSAGSNAVITVTLTNRGPVIATDLLVTNVFPAPAALVAASAIAGTVITNAGGIAWSLPQLDVGAFATLNFTLRSARTGIVTVVTSAGTSSPDPEAGDNTAVVTFAVGNATDVDVLELVQVPANDILWSPSLSRLLIASTAGNATWGGSLLSLDPLDLSVRFARTLGGDARTLTLAPDETLLHVGVDRGMNTLTLPSLSVSNYYLINPLDPRSYAYECEPVPGGGGLLVGSRSFTDNGTWLAVYDAGVARTNLQNFSTSGFSLEFGSDPSLFYYQDFASGGFRRYSVNSNGVTLLETISSLLPTSKPIELRWANGLIYAGNGAVIDPVSRLVVRSVAGITNTASTCYEDKARRVYYLMPVGTNALLQAVDSFTSVPLASRLISGYSGSPTDLVRWGTNGLAFRTSSNQIALIRSSLVPDGPAADLALRLSAPVAVAMVGSNFLYSVAVTNLGPSPATNVQATLWVSSGAVTNVLLSQGSATKGGQQCVASFGVIPSGGAASAEVTVVPSQPGSLSALASVSSSAGDPELGNNTQGLTNTSVLYIAKDSVVSISQSAADLAYDAVHARLYASSKASSVVVINPALSQIETNWPVPSQPGRLAISENGENLFVAIDSSRQLARLQTATGQVLTNFALGTNSGGTSLTLLDMEMIPGTAQSLAVMASAGGARYLTAWDDAVTRSNPLQIVFGSFLEFGADPARVYLSGLIPFDLSSNSVSAPGGDSLFATTANFKFGGSLFYTDAGEQVNPSDWSSIQRFTGLGTGTLVQPEISRQRLFFLTKISTNWQLRAYDPVTTSPVGSMVISNVQGTPSALTRWGDDGFAFCTTSNQIFLLRSSLVPAGAAADLRVSQTPDPSGFVNIGSNLVFQVQVTNAGPADAASASLQLRFPAGLVPQQFQWMQGITNATTNLSSGQLTCAWGILSNGASARFNITFRPVNAGALVQVASLTSANSDPDLGNNLDAASVPVRFTAAANSWGVVALQTSDLQYDVVGGMLYATVTNYFGTPWENAIVPIDPSSGAVGTPLIAGPKATQLALADDGSQLSVLINNGREFRQMPIPAGTPASRVPFSLPTTSSSWSETIRAVPGQSGSVAVVVQRPGILLGDPRATIYDGPIARPSQAATRTVEFYSPDQLMGFEWRQVPDASSRIALNSSGLAPQAGASYLVDGDMAASGGFIYTSAGSVINPASMTKLRSFGVSGPVAPDAAADRVAFVTGSGTTRVLQVFDTQKLRQWGSLTISNVVGNPSRLIRCGADRLAFQTSGGQVFIVRSSAIPVGEPADLALNVGNENPRPVVSVNFPLSLRVTNLGPASASNVVVSSTLPVSLRLQANASSQGVTTNAPGIVDWFVGDLAPGAVATNQLLLLAQQGGALAAQSFVYSSTRDSNAVNNLVTTSWLVDGASAPGALASYALSAGDMVWEPLAQKLILSLQHPTPSFSNCLMRLDPVSGQFGSPIPTGVLPNKLAVSDDEHHAFVGIDSTPTLAKVDLWTGQVLTNYYLGTVYQVTLPPSLPDLFIVASPGNLDAYRDGMELPAYRDFFWDWSSIITRPTAAGRFYGCYGTSFYRMTLTSESLTVADNTAGLLPNSAATLDYNGSFLFANNGTVVQPEALTLVTNLPDISADALCKPDVASGKLNFITQKSGAWFLRQYSHTNYALLREIRIPGVLGQPRSLVRWGTDGLAFLTSSNQLFLTRPSAAVMDLSLQHTSVPNQAIAGQAFQIVLALTNAGPSFEADALVTNTVPAQTVLLGAQSSQGTNSITGNRVTFALGALPAGAIATITLTLQPTNASNVTFTNAAVGTWAFFDSNPANNAVVAVFAGKADTDRDGLPDDWELSRGLNPTNAVDAALDSDCDGASNLSEYLAGTDPFGFDNLRLLAPRLNAQGQLEMTLNAQPGRNYVLESSSNLVNWSRLQSFVCRTANQAVTVKPSAAPSFFRLRADTNALPPVLYLLNPSSLATNAPLLEVIAPPGRAYTLQASTDLVHWVNLTNYYGLSCSTILSDSGGGAPARFYRVLIP